MPEQKLRETLRKIEALFAGASTEGERTVAGLAAERIRERLRESVRGERETGMRFPCRIRGSANCLRRFANITDCNFAAIPGCTVRP